ncbi:MAG: hypothetical protein P4L87_12675 [Formivibrio sp.]|nr:hypothetical protein [Formivibrio sp.]
MAEGFGQVTAHSDQPIKRVVVVLAQSLATVADPRQVAVGIVIIGPGQQALLVLADAMFGEATLFVVLVLAEQLPLLTLLLAPGAVLVAGQALAIEVNGAEVAAGQVAIVQGAAVGQARMAELAERVVAVVQGSPTLVLGGQAVLQVVLIRQRPVTVSVLTCKRPAVSRW